MNDLAATFHDSSRLMLAFARVVRNYALRVHSDPLAGRGPCGRPPWQDNQFPIRGADGHKGEAAAKLICLDVYAQSLFLCIRYTVFMSLFPCICPVFFVPL